MSDAILILKIWKPESLLIILQINLPLKSYGGPLNLVEKTLAFYRFLVLLSLIIKITTLLCYTTLSLLKSCRDWRWSSYSDIYGNDLLCIFDGAYNLLFFCIIRKNLTMEYMPRRMGSKLYFVPRKSNEKCWPHRKSNFCGIVFFVSWQILNSKMIRWWVSQIHVSMYKFVFIGNGIIFSV